MKAIKLSMPLLLVAGLAGWAAAAATTPTRIGSSLPSRFVRTPATALR
jgi:hypothetical protein